MALKNHKKLRPITGLRGLCAARRGVFVALALGLLAGCATGMSEDECVAADWGALGEADGLAGAAAGRFSERAENCSKFKIGADAAAYDAGRRRGLARYCTPASGFEQGRKGQPYYDVCPAGLADAFLVEYEIGTRLYQLTRDYDGAVERYRQATDDLEDARYDLQRKRDRYRENTLSDEERASLQDDIRDLRRTVEAIENDLPLLEASIDRARFALEDYRAFIDQRGR
ncbi:MAG: DUF2799 domain-containing protein [Pseudomonadota bacterium]